MVYTAYLIITPDPRRDQVVQESDGQYFYVKFGDGSGNKSVYHRAKPDHGFAENTLAPSEKLRTHDANARPITVQCGKYLEWVLIWQRALNANYEGTEWHRLRVRQGKHVYEMCRVLEKMLELFPTYDWDPRSEGAFERELNKAWDNSGDWLGEFDDIVTRHLDPSGNVKQY